MSFEESRERKLELAARPALDDFYHLRGTVDRSVECKGYDLCWLLRGASFKVEEKVRSLSALRFDDCLVELRQDLIRPLSEGWLHYSEADVLCYAFFDKEKGALLKHYVVWMESVREGYERVLRHEGSNFKKRFSIAPGGWGMTLNASIRWDEIQDVHVYKPI